MSKVHAIIVAAGSGSRFGGPLPKQFMPLGGIPVVMRAIARLRQAIEGLSDTIVLSKTEIERWNKLCEENSFKSPKIVVGGATRFESVKNALNSVPEDTDIVLVHDGARPLPTVGLVENLMNAFDRIDVQGAIPAVPVTDSLRIVYENGESEAVERAKYRAVQTPQAFRKHLLMDAYDHATCPENFTDDASVMEFSGYKNLVIIDGDSKNIKITNPFDISIAEVFLYKE